MCLTAVLLEVSILLVNLLSLTVIYVYDKSISKRNICQSFEACRKSFEDYKMTIVYALTHTHTISHMYANNTHSYVAIIM